MYKQKEFLDWYKNNPPSTELLGISPYTWYQKWNRSHQVLYKFFKSYEKTFELKAESPKNFKLPTEAILRIANQLKRIIPRFFKTHSIDILQSADCLDQYKRVVKTSRYVMGWLERNTSCSEDLIARCNEQLSLLGTLWSFGNASPSAKIVLSIKPHNFLNLGHFLGVDTNSCFHILGVNEIHKFVLGQTKNSFIALIPRENGDVLTRLFGFFNDNLNQICFTNRYGYDAWDACRQFFYKIAQQLIPNCFPIDPPKIKNVWQNHDTFAFGTTNDPWLIECDDHNLNNYRRCFHCSRLLKEGETYKFSKNYLYCQNCYKTYSRYGKCELTGVNCFQERVPVFNDQNQQIYVCQYVRNDFFKYSSLHGKYYPKNCLELTDTGHWIYPSVMPQYKKCICGQYTLNLDAHKDCSI